jgi:hypothetical protein
MPRFLAFRKEPRERLALLLLLAEHQVASRIQADEPGTGNARSRALARVVRGELVVLGMGDQGGHADRFKVVVIHIRVGNECVEDEPVGAHGEQTVDEFVDVPGVLSRHDELFRDGRDHADHR